MRRAVYPGRFDPVTLGHIDIIQRASEIVDELIVGVLVNKGKNPLFSVQERVNMLQIVTKDIPNIRVESFDGLLVDFLKLKDAEFVIRGLRAITDFEYELQMAQTNRIMSPDTDTIFLTTNLKYAYLNSTTVKEVASDGGDISKFVPEFVAGAVMAKYSNR
ncbi:MAG: pantetheine-phosphate adenylyltransferase [Lachnospiraceae bacterium]|nr:pantetheine-phosphate adenylyltransferase [Lachnospiraceae bacterium]